jgi:hypothetical protein
MDAKIFDVCAQAERVGRVLNFGTTGITGITVMVCNSGDTILKGLT